MLGCLVSALLVLLLVVAVTGITFAVAAWASVWPVLLAAVLLFGLGHTLVELAGLAWSMIRD